jgi:hypothetical protein
VACERINSVELPLVDLQANVKINVARNLPEKLKGALALHSLSLFDGVDNIAIHQYNPQKSTAYPKTHH